jgi:hypothetical protein
MWQHDTYQNKKFLEQLIAYFSWYNTDRIENDVSNNSSIVAHVLFAAVSFFLPSRCLAKIEGYIYRHMDWWKGFMNYAVNMGSSAMKYQVSYIVVKALKS